MPAAAAARELVCQSYSNQRTICQIPAGSRVKMQRQLSSAPCIEGETWGVGDSSVWVSRRCAARFLYAKPEDKDDGALIGALIVGGLIGALIGSQIDDGDRYPYRPSRPLPGGISDREAVGLCNEKAREWGRRKDWVEVRFNQLISSEPFGNDTVSVRAIMTVRYRDGWRGPVLQKNLRYRCSVTNYKVTGFDWY